MTKNTESTRYFSSQQEKAVAELLEGYANSSSGSGMFSKGDVIVKKASLLVECKTCTSPKESFSIKKDWIIKNKEEALDMRLDNYCLAFNYGLNTPNYFVIDEKLMSFLVDKLKEEYDEEN